jgi:2-iminobutanoate/2-iminopropanoate deaminase
VIVEKQALHPEGIRKATVPISSVVISGDLVYVSGQGGFDADGNLPGDFRAEVRQTLENIGLCLASAGCGFGDVLRCGGFLADLGDFAAYNEVYREFFSEPFPARTTVQTGLASGMRVEIDAVARKPA